MTHTKPTNAMTLSERIHAIADMDMPTAAVSALRTLANEIQYHESSTEHSATLETASDWLALPSGDWLNMANASLIQFSVDDVWVTFADQAIDLPLSAADAIRDWLKQRAGQS